MPTVRCQSKKVKFSKILENTLDTAMRSSKPLPSKARISVRTLLDALFEALVNTAAKETAFC